jgi:hypothetical protein
MNQELIQRVEREVRKVLEQQSLTPSPSTPDKEFLAIVDAVQTDIGLPLQQLEQCIQAGYLVHVILSDLAAKVLNISNITAVCGPENVWISGQITDLKSFLARSSLVVLPVLSHSMAAKLALGIADTVCTYLVFQALLRGDSVIATSELFEKSGENERASAFLKRTQDYLKTVSELGVQFVQTDQIAEVILEGNAASSYRSVHPVKGKTVISASVIAKISPTVQEFVYENPAIITPLARDLANQRGIRLVPKAK